MQVSVLLQAKGSEVVTVPPETPISVVADQLAAHRIGAVVVTPDGATVAGIVSERDIVWALARRGAAVLDEPVAELMSTELTTCEPDTTVDWLMATMTEQRVRHVPVLVDGGLAGLVSIGDVVKHHVAVLEHETQAMHDYIAHPY
jgi:CBS domain-containing protein